MKWYFKDSNSQELKLVSNTCKYPDSLSLVKNYTLSIGKKTFYFHDLHGCLKTCKVLDFNVSHFQGLDSAWSFAWNCQVLENHLFIHLLHIITCSQSWKFEKCRKKNLKNVNLLENLSHWFQLLSLKPRLMLKYVLHTHWSLPSWLALLLPCFLNITERLIFMPTLYVTSTTGCSMIITPPWWNSHNLAPSKY